MSTSKDACYCSEREDNPDLFAELPPGYCGTCAYCGKPGHTRAHPHQPVSHGWCDEHWQDQVEGRIISLNQILAPVLVFVLIVVPAVIWLWRLIIGK